MLRLAVAVALAGTGAAHACRFPSHLQAIPGSLVGEARQFAPGPGISAAWYELPTDIYGHGIMGAVPDAARLTAYVAESANSCGTQSADAGEGHVFEDTAPRLADLDGDGLAEIIAVRSSLTEGAQLAVYVTGSDGLKQVAATPYIGRRNRWLAPLGAHDLDGDGAMEIAYVDRPHLAKTLRIWRFADGALMEVAALPGVTNHRIGDEVIWGGIRPCDGAMILADAGWTTLLSVRFDGTAFATTDLGRAPMPANWDAALAC